MTAPRIDTLRRDVSDAIDLLRFLADNLEDLHVLAYNRHQARQDAKVRGGSRDYALDSHGDTDARKLYQRVSELTEGLIEGRQVPARTAPTWVDGIVSLTAEVRGYLTKGSTGGKRDGSADATADEVLAQFRARRRRLARGEYEPVPLAQQVVPVASMDWQVECEVLRSAVRKVTREFAEDHQFCRAPEEGIGRFKRKLLRRYPTKMLSTREREAWRRATQSVADEDQRAAS